MTVEQCVFTYFMVIPSCQINIFFVLWFRAGAYPTWWKHRLVSIYRVEDVGGLQKSVGSIGIRSPTGECYRNCCATTAILPRPGACHISAWVRQRTIKYLINKLWIDQQQNWSSPRILFNRETRYWCVYVCAERIGVPYSENVRDGRYD